MFVNYSRLRNNTFFKVAVVVGVSYILYLLGAFMLPILLSVALTFILFPVVNYIANFSIHHAHLRIPRGLIITVSVVGFCAFMVLAIFFLIFPLFDQINELTKTIPGLVAKAKVTNLDTVLNDMTNIPLLPSNFEMLADDAINWAMNAVGSMVRNLLQSSLDIISNLIGLIIVPFLAFYFLNDWHDLRAMAVDFFNVKDQPKAGRVFDEIGHTLSAYVNGLVKLSLLAGVCVTVFALLVGVKYPLVWGLCAFLTEVIPVVGAMMCAVPSVFIAYGQSPTIALYLAIFYLVYYTIDAKIIMPKLMGNKVNLHPVVIIISVLIGAKLYGILGMAFAVPVAAVYRVLYDELWHAGECLDIVGGKEAEAGGEQAAELTEAETADSAEESEAEVDSKADKSKVEADGKSDKSQA